MSASAAPPRIDRRSNNFDALRLFAAWCVLFGHCYPLAGLNVADPFSRVVGIDTLGGLGVSIFFVLSGYLVTLSWQRSTGIAVFLWKRIRRIYPALIVCVLISALLLGPILTTLDLASYVVHQQTSDYIKNSTAWSTHYVLPGVFSKNVYPNAVNGSLWTLPYEIRCYLVVVVVGVLPFALRFKVLLTTLLLSAMLVQRPVVPPASPFDQVFGLNYYMVKLGLFFAVGATYACWRDQLVASCWVGALALLAAWSLPDSSLRNLLWILALSSFILGVALNLPWLPKLPEKMGDWSYGLYLYAFPVQQLLSYLGVVQWVGFAGYVVLCTIVALGCAGVSWFLVERPALAIETLWRAPSAGDLKAKPGPLIS